MAAAIDANEGIRLRVQLRVTAKQAVWAISDLAIESALIATHMGRSDLVSRSMLACYRANALAQIKEARARLSEIEALVLSTEAESA